MPSYLGSFLQSLQSLSGRGPKDMISTRQARLYGKHSRKLLTRLARAVGGLKLQEHDCSIVLYSGDSLFALMLSSTLLHMPCVRFSGPPKTSCRCRKITRKRCCFLESALAPARYTSWSCSAIYLPHRVSGCHLRRVRAEIRVELATVEVPLRLDL